METIDFEGHDLICVLVGVQSPNGFESKPNQTH